MPEYETRAVSGGKVWILSPGRGSLEDVDAVVFDCDGVLVDTRRSYDATIVRVVDSMVPRIVGLRVSWKTVGPDLIRMLRRTGGFNNDWNVAYALILFSVVAARTPGPKVSRIRQITKAFCSSTDGMGYKAVDGFVASMDGGGRVLAEVRGHLGYPGSPPTSAMAALFDEIYHGADLYTRMYGVEPSEVTGRGLIERDRVVVRERTLGALSRLVGRNMAIATGRPALAARYTLGKLLDYFDPGASVFMGEADVHPEIAPDYLKYQKPSGFSLTRARSLFAADRLLYIGDSEEDRMMVDDARDSEPGAFLFAGVYGTAGDKPDQVKYLKAKGADLIVKSVNQLPGLLEMGKS